MVDGWLRCCAITGTCAHMKHSGPLTRTSNAYAARISMWHVLTLQGTEIRPDAGVTYACTPAHADVRCGQVLQRS